MLNVIFEHKMCSFSLISNNLISPIFLVKSLSDIFPDGGSIPAIDLVICKRYPKMFREQMKDIVTQNITYTHLTEAEEASRQSDYDMKHQRASEKYADTARKECSEVSCYSVYFCLRLLGQSLFMQ